MDSKRAWGISLFCSILLLVAGCSYNTLKIFFDGVPDPAKKKAAEQQLQQQALPSMRVERSEHAPYAAKQCDACHNPNSLNQLIAPKEELCYICHEFPTNKKSVHGPLVSGGCLVCHDPHNSRYRKLLVSESDSFCFYCHDQQSIMQSATHQDVGLECTTCHDAHMSDNPYLLK